MTEWDLRITRTTQLQAPGKVSVTWEGGITADVLLSGPVVIDAATRLGEAHYRTTSNLDRAITSATAQIQGPWDGAFESNGGPCPGKRTFTLTTIPACTASVTAWDFTISSVTAALAPASVMATWTVQAAPEAVALTGAVGADGIAHYTTTAHTGSTFLALVSVTADLTFASEAEAAAFTGALAAPGIPCAPPPPPSPTPTPPPVKVGACVPIHNPAGKHIPDPGENPRCLARHPDRRPRSAAQLAVALERILEEMKFDELLAWPRGTPVVPSGGHRGR